MLRGLRGYEIVFGGLLTVAVFAVFSVIFKSGHGGEEILGVKRGEWLLFAATMGLWWATSLLVRGADRTSERQLRAYVHVTDAVILHDNDEWSPNIRVTIKNFGKTPARRLRHDIGHNVTIKGPGDFALKQGLHVADLGPDQHIVKTMIVRRAMWHDLLKPMMKTGTGYIFGKVTYEDAFGKLRTTSYRFQISFDDEGAAGVSFSPDGNYSD